MTFESLFHHLRGEAVAAEVNFLKNGVLGNFCLLEGYEELTENETFREPG
jgi:hypothetical protein